MVKRCVPAGCSSTHADSVSLHSFPKDSSLRKVWIKQVQRYRAKWTATPYSVLCSKHFGDEYFEVEHKLASSFGLKTKRKLKADAVPTIFERPPQAPVQFLKLVVNKEKLPVWKPSWAMHMRRSAYENREIRVSCKTKQHIASWSLKLLPATF